MKALKIRQKGQAPKRAGSVSCAGYQGQNNASNYLLLCLENISNILIEGFFILITRIFSPLTSAISGLVLLEMSLARVTAQKKKSTLPLDTIINLTQRGKPSALHQGYS